MTGGKKRKRKDKRRAEAKRLVKNKRDAILGEVRQIVLNHAATADLVARLPVSTQEARIKWQEGVYKKRSVWVNAQAGAPGLGKRK